MKTKFVKTMTIALGITMASVLAQPALAGGSVQHSANAVKHSVQAGSHTAKAGLKLSAGVVAVPLAIVGGVGTASAHASEDLWELANSDGEVGLPVSDETVTAGPNPTTAMQTGAEQ